MLSKYPTLIVCLFVSVSIFAQTTDKEAVILYNKEAVRVELSQEGDINRFIKTEPSYMAGFDIVNDKVNVLPVATNSAKGSTVATNAEYNIVSTQRIMLDFSLDAATLDKSIIGKLDGIAAFLKRNPNQKVLLTTHELEDAKSKLLSKNRLNSALVYLKIKGIDQSRIVKETLNSPDLSNSISAVYMK